MVCPGGGFDDYKPIKRVVKYLQGLNYKVKLGNSLVTSNTSFNYLSGPDNKREADFVKLWNDQNIDAIFCLRGGYGCLRLLNTIEFELLRRTKKILLGFSDITILLLAICARLDLVTFHGPLLGHNFIKSNLTPVDILTEQNMWQLLKSPSFNFSYSLKSKIKVVNKGKAVGRLIGGNLTSICCLLGTDYLPDFKNSILFLEECNEEPYKIDRMLTQLINIGIFGEVSGIVLGDFYQCGFRSKQQIIDLIKNRVDNYKIPIVSNFPVGHRDRNYTLPIGQEVILDTYSSVLCSASRK